MNNVTKISLCMAALALGACAGMAKKDQTPEEAVMERAQARYDALMQKDRAGLEAALAFTTPSFREYTTAGQYNPLVAGRAFWSSVKPSKATCEEDVCEVIFDVTYKPPQINFPLTRPLKDKWLFIDGEWWIYHK